MISKTSLRFTVAGVATAATIGLAGAASACTPAAAAARPAPATSSTAVADEAHGGSCAPGVVERGQSCLPPVPGHRGHDGHGKPWMSCGRHGAPAVPRGPHSAPAVAKHAGITAKPSTKSVRAWQLFHVTGTTSGIKAGSVITLQQKQHGTFVSLPASMHTDHHGSYRLGVKLGIKGVNELRIVSGHVASPVFTVNVR
ncbi:hypothetical protein ACFZB9_18565 [Kitasatospora sp. NPDC008050]|uniref:hypothetical protein n=1 Tax=Kitasatospora sp. NPDC008050 TaxID=3364021 RepID=UPI0036E2FE15